LSPNKILFLGDILKRADIWFFLLLRSFLPLDHFIIIVVRGKNFLKNRFITKIKLSENKF